MMKICVCGYGIVGKGVVDILDRSSDQVKYIYTRNKLNDNRQVENIDTVLNDDEVAIIVETMGGIEPAYTILRDAIKNNKHVITSNKELVEKHGAKLHELAIKHNIQFLFEASVAGGIPLMSTIRYSLEHEKITGLEAILNGTSNYILSKMFNDNLSFEEALKEAQDLGYAEKDPTEDIEGFDAGRKVAIIASVISGKQTMFKDIKINGISNISEAMIDYARKEKAKIKLIAKLSFQEDGISMSVMPTLINDDHALYNVENVNNAILFKTHDIGEVLIQGPGAGRYPTASAIISDIKTIERENKRRLAWTKEKAKLVDLDLKILDFNDNMIRNLSEVAHSNYLVIGGASK